MKHRQLTAAGCAFLLAAFGAGAASAQGVPRYDPPPRYEATPRIDQREAQQQRRIVQGARSGQLTPHEYRRLQRQQAAIHRMERRARADGVVTRAERREIARAQQRASRAIYSQKHDRQRY